MRTVPGFIARTVSAAGPCRLILAVAGLLWPAVVQSQAIEPDLAPTLTIEILPAPDDPFMLKFGYDPAFSRLEVRDMRAALAISHDLFADNHTPPPYATGIYFGRHKLLAAAEGDLVRLGPRVDFFGMTEADFWDRTLAMAAPDDRPSRYNPLTGRVYVSAPELSRAAMTRSLIASHAHYAMDHWTAGALGFGVPLVPFMTDYLVMLYQIKRNLKFRSKESADRLERFRWQQKRPGTKLALERKEIAIFPDSRIAENALTQRLLRQVMARLDVSRPDFRLRFDVMNMDSTVGWAWILTRLDQAGPYFFRDYFRAVRAVLRPAIGSVCAAFASLRRCLVGLDPATVEPVLCAARVAAVPTLYDPTLCTASPDHDALYDVLEQAVTIGDRVAAACTDAAVAACDGLAKAWEQTRRYLRSSVQLAAYDFLDGYRPGQGEP